MNSEELMLEFNETYGPKREFDCKKYPSTLFVPGPPDAATVEEANEWQGLNKKRKEGETYKEIIKRAKVAVSQGPLDEYTPMLLKDMASDIFGEAWRKLDIVRGRIVKDHDLIVDLLKVIDGLTDRCVGSKRKLQDMESKGES